MIDPEEAGGKEREREEGKKDGRQSREGGKKTY